MNPVTSFAAEPRQAGLSPSFALQLSRRGGKMTTFAIPSGDKLSINRLRLAEFLRSRRDRLQPADFGLPSFRRRRTRGLRRDDVAELAGISVTYYTWIEQARELNLSREVVESIAGALRFNGAERKYISTLAGLPASDELNFGDKLHPAVAHILQDSSACALVRDQWFNVVAASALAREVFSIGQDPHSKNIIWRLCFDSNFSSIWTDHKKELQLCIGMFRQSLANDPESSAGNRLLQELNDHPGFAGLWNACDVELQPSPQDYFREEPWEVQHPKVGLIRFHRISMSVPCSNQSVLKMISPADDMTRKKFQHLSSRHPDFVEARASIKIA